MREEGQQLPDDYPQKLVALKTVVRQEINI